MSKKKSRITHAQLLAEGVVWVPTEPLAKKPVTTTSLAAAADVVHPKPAPTNVAIKIVDQKRKMPPTATGLQRAINANLLQQGFEVPTPKVDESKTTGLQRAINANISKPKN
jgi:hypothetical protein